MSSPDRPWRLIASLCGVCFRFEQSHGYEPATCSSCGARFSLGSPWMGIHMRVLTSPDRTLSTIEHSLEAMGDWTAVDVDRALDVVRETIGVTATPRPRSSAPPPSRGPLEPEQTETRVRSLGDTES